jgi:hypothetical protein
LADAGQLDEDDVAELVLGLVGDADGAGRAVDADVFVVFGESGGHAVAFRT